MSTFAGGIGRTSYYGGLSVLLPNRFLPFPANRRPDFVLAHTLTGKALRLALAFAAVIEAVFAGAVFQGVPN